MGRMVEHLKHERTSHSFSEDLYEDGGEQVSTGFQTGWCDTVWAWCFFPFLLPKDLAQLVFADLNCRCGGDGGLLEVLMVVWRGIQSGCGVFFKPAIELNQID